MEFKYYILDCQFNDRKDKLSELDIKEGYGFPKVLQTIPKYLPTGTVLYGVAPDGELVLVKANYDTSG